MFIVLKKLSAYSLKMMNTIIIAIFFHPLLKHKVFILIKCELLNKSPMGQNWHLVRKRFIWQFPVLNFKFNRNNNPHIYHFITSVIHYPC